jgi:hypothetical protein
MKKLMLIGGMLGFAIGIIFGRLQSAEDSTVLWRSCVAALAAGWLMRWWGQVWVRNIHQAHADRLARQQRN